MLRVKSSNRGKFRPFTARLAASGKCPTLLSDMASLPAQGSRSEGVRKPARLAGAFTLLALLLALVPLGVFAAPGWAENYIKYTWDEPTQTLSPEDIPIPAGATQVTSSDTAWTGTGGNPGWYFVTDNVTISGRITVSGDVHLVLCDNATLTALEGITVVSGDALTIYAQSEGDAMGKLCAGTNGDAGGDGKPIVTCDERSAGIGGGDGGAGGAVTLHGGTVTATGGEYAAGIGGGDGGAGGAVTLYGGTVTATGDGGGGIGGGLGGTGGTVTIYGGVVTATSDDGAGIGGGVEAAGGNVTLYGGVVTARSEGDGAGIGGGYSGAGGTVTLYGGTVTVRSEGYGAGIGGGAWSNGGTVEIHGGTVTANGGSDPYNYNGAGIGGGDGGAGGTVTITGGAVTATGGVGGAGIGGGAEGACGKVEITGGTVTANGGASAAGIGGGAWGNGGTVEIHGGTVTANGGSSPDSESGAGIGGGVYGKGGTVEITGGTVMTSGGNGAQGIGGGYNGGGDGSLKTGTGIKLFGDTRPHPEKDPSNLRNDEEHTEDNGQYTGERYQYMTACVTVSHREASRDASRETMTYTEKNAIATPVTDSPTAWPHTGATNG